MKRMMTFGVGCLAATLALSAGAASARAGEPALLQLGDAAGLDGSILAQGLEALRASAGKLDGVAKIETRTPQQEVLDAMKPWIEKYAKVKQEDYQGKSSPRYLCPADLLEEVRGHPELTRAQAEELKRLVAKAEAQTKRDWENTVSGAPSCGLSGGDQERFLAVLSGGSAAVEAAAPRVEAVRLSVSGGCALGWMSASVELEVRTGNGAIRRSFSPSCGFTFSETVRERGVVCRIESGMCSSFMGRGAIEATCAGVDGARRSDSQSVPCR